MVWGVQMGIPRVEAARTPADLRLVADDPRSDIGEDRRTIAPRHTRRSLSATARLERDRARGYSINVKQVGLAFAAEFVIIGLVLVSQFVYAAEFPNPSQYKTIQALLFPIAFAVVELARVPLAIAVRTQNSWNIKLAALIGVMAAVVVTSFSLSQIGHLTFNPRLEDAHDKQKIVLELQAEKQAMGDQKNAVQTLIEQRAKIRDSASEAQRNVLNQLQAQPPQQCTQYSKPNPDGTVTQGQTCRENPALKTVKAELETANRKLAEAEAALKQAQVEFLKFDLRPLDLKITKAETVYRDAVYQSQLHSYTAMLFGKDPREVSDAEVKTLEWYLIFIPSIAAALSSTLIAMTAVRRIRQPKSEETATIPDEAAAYLFGPLVAAIRSEAQEAVSAAMDGRSRAPPEKAAVNS